MVENESNRWTGKQITERHLAQLFDEQKGLCAITGRQLTPDNVSLDHRVPLKSGGLHDMSNVQLVHADANAAKGTLSMAEFIAICKEVATRHP